jgi:hypothetical protein
VSAGEGRTVAELLDDSDGVAREALLDMSAGRALGMVRGWPQLMQSAAELWAVLPPDQAMSGNGDSIGILVAMGRAVGRSLAAGHWPGRGPRDEAWEQIASNFVQARRLLQRRSEAPGGQSGPTTSNTQMLHTLYVAAHATAVALTGYQRDLQHRLEVGTRRRHPLVERPTALEVESAGGMIARFDAIEQLAAGSLTARRLNAADKPATGRGRSAMRLEAALPPGRSRPTGHSPASRTRPIWLRVARVQALIATTTVVVSDAAARRGEIDALARPRRCRRPHGQPGSRPSRSRPGRPAACRPRFQQPMLTIHDRPFPPQDRSEPGHWESQCCCQAAVRAGSW